MPDKVRVRFAPSPTGYLHVGNARAALFNWLFARNQGGTFILRVEDTDEARSTAEAVAQIYDGLKWLGLDWDEGPFFQSKRLDLYKAAGEKLLAEGKAYRCFCTTERLEALREAAAKAKRAFIYDGLCHRLDPAEAERRAAAGETHVLRFHVPPRGLAEMNDLVRGHVKVDRALLGDFVLTRPDGMPTFNFANVIDDHDMRVSHVIRGEDHLPNTARHILLYQAMGYEPPIFAHLPLILGPDRQKLSKRHGAVSVMAYHDEGYMPEAFVNFLALLGWSVDDKTEVLTRQEMVEKFSLDRVGKAGAVFNIEKLQWLNGVYFRAQGEAECIRQAREFMKGHGPDPDAFDREWLDNVIRLEIERSRNLSLLVEHIGFFLNDEIQFDEKAVAKHLKKPGVATTLDELAGVIESAPDLRAETLEPALRGLAEKLGIGFSKVVHPCRVALTGVEASPGIFDVLGLLGKERVLKRLRYARETLCEG